MKELIPIVFAILAGIFTTIEANLNARLGQIVTPKIATLHSLVTGVIVILVANIIKGTLNQYAKISSVSPGLLIGGVFGTFIIYLVIKAVPKLGVANTLTIVVASQVLSGLLVDVYSQVDYELSWRKVVGLLCMLMGVYLITK